MEAQGHGIFVEFSETEEADAVFLEKLNFGGVVPSMLDFTDVSTPEHKLTEATLSDASTNRLGECSVKQHSVPDVILAFGAAAQVKLLVARIGVDSDPHRRELERRLKDWVPNKDVAVQSSAAVGTGGDPIIVIGGPSVVTELPVSLDATDAHEENGTMLPAQNVFSLFGGGVGVLLDHFIRVGKVNILREARRHPVRRADDLMGFINRLINILDCFFQVVNIPFVFRDDLLPIPLVDVWWYTVESNDHRMLVKY